MSRLRAAARTLRVLILGETIVIPAAVAVLVGVGLLAHEVAPASWRHVGGAALLLITVSALVLATRAPRR